MDLSAFLDTNDINSNRLFSSTTTPSSSTSPISHANVYQPSDIIALLEPNSSSIETKSIDNSHNDLTNTSHDTNNTRRIHASSSTIFNPVLPSCSSAAAAGAAALFQENLLSSLFNSYEPFSKLFSDYDDDATRSSSHYHHHHHHHHHIPSPLLTTAPNHNHTPMYHAHNISWH
jgi:hypothetical protein